EAAQATVKYGFKEMNLHRIIATCQPQNIPSYRVMEKIGMRREGYFRRRVVSQNALFKLKLLSLKRQVD
ncbi:hypothetical protein CN405_23180, partial [Bacillus cereus]